MRKLIYLFLAILMLLPAALQASIYGSISGYVTDDEGKGVVGATVRILNEPKGAIVRNKDGYFVITNLVANNYTLQVTFIGKDTIVQKVNVSADQDTKVKMIMKDKGFTTGDIVVTANLVSEQIGSIKTSGTKDIVNTARENLTGVIGLSSGVITSSNGFIIRGSRPTDTQIRLDNLDISNQFSGGFGLSGSTYYPMVSNYATQEVQVITGGFSAEYGEAMGGIVNSVMKTGDPKRYEGFVNYQTDLPALFGSQNGGVGIEPYGNQLRAVSQGDGAKLDAEGQHKVEAGLGGPIPFLDGSSFYFNPSYQYVANRNNGYNIDDGAGNDLGNLPDNQLWERNIALRMKLQMSDAIYLTIGGNYGLTSWESSSWGSLYSNQQGMVYNQLPDGSFQQQFNSDGTPMLNGIPERIAEQNVTDQFVYNVFLRINHQLSQTAFYDFTISNTSNNDESSRRVGWNDPSFFGGFEKYLPQDNYTRDINAPDKLVAGKDRIIDQYQFLSQLGTSDDGYYNFDKPIVNPLTGYYEGPYNNTGSNNPWGLARFTSTHGGGYYSFRSGNYWQIDGNYNDQFRFSEFTHKFRAGFAVDFYEMQRSYNGSPYDANAFYDVYTDGKWGGNLLATSQAQLDITSHAEKPTKFYVYAQDQILFKGMNITGGLRFDYFDPNSKYRLPSASWTPIDGPDSLFGQASVKYQISPRLNITYPISDVSVLSMSYGMFFKMPELQNMYDQFNLGNNPRGGNIVGQPNMDAQRTNQYEVKYNHKLTEIINLSASIYYKDIYNLIGTNYVATVPDAYTQYTVAEYGNSRGIEFTLSKQATIDDHFSLDLNYVLSSTEGTASSAASNAGVTLDPYTKIPTFPLAPYPLSFDIRHQAKGNLVFYLMKDDGPSIGGLKILENTNFIFSGSYRSGTPYTKTSVDGKAISDNNTERNPSIFSLDMKIQRTFDMKDIFGDGAGNSQVSFFIQVYNLLDATSPIAYYTATGDPIDDGKQLTLKPGDFSAAAYYKNASFDNPNTFSSIQYDSYGQRIYNVNADTDGNGIVTQAETYGSYIKYLDTVLSFKGNFQGPRTVYFGMVFTF